MRPLPWLAVTLVIAATPRSARAESPWPVPQSDAEISARLAVVQPRLVAAAPAARRWYWRWSIAFTAATAVSFGSLLVFDDPGRRHDAVVAGSLSTIGVLSTITFPLTAMRADRVLATMPESTPEERAAKLRRAEELLATAAKEERFLSGFFGHAGVFAANLGGAAVQRWAYDRPWDIIALTRGVGVVVGELKVLTTPVAAVHDADDYVRSLAIVPTVDGVVVAGTF